MLFRSTYADGTSTTASTLVPYLSHSTTYTFRISAVNAAGTGTASDAASVATATTAGAPTGLTATQGVAEVDLAWTAPASDGGAALTDYTVEYSSDSGSTWTTFEDGTSTTGSTTVTGLSNGTTYVFRVSAANAVGTGAVSDSASATTVSEPDPPTGLSATAGIEEVALSWTAPSSNGGSAITDYTVEYSSDSGTTWTTFTDGTSTTASTTVTGLANSTTYTFRVSAVNAAGTGTASDTGSVATRGLTISQLVPSLAFERGTSVAIRNDGTPFVTSYANNALKGTDCQNSDCTTETTESIDSSINRVGQYSAVVIGSDGNPVVAYEDETNGHLKVAACLDTACSSATITSIDQGGSSNNSVGFYIAIAIGADDNPVITHYDLTDTALKVVACSNPTCTSATITAVSSPKRGEWSSVAIGADNNPVISFFDNITGHKLFVAICSNTTCTSSTVTYLTSNNGRQSSIAIGSDNNPIISTERSGALEIVACADTACSSTTTTSLGVSLTQPGDSAFERGTQIAIGTDDKPVIVFTDSDGNLGVAECSATDCSTGATISTIADAGTSVSLAIRDSDNARIITYLDPGNAMSLKIAVLSAP